jgi:hypothetical protein
MPLLTGLRVGAALLLAFVLVPALGELGAAAGFLTSELVLLLLASRACAAARFEVPLAAPLLRALGVSLPMAGVVALLGAGLITSVGVGALVYVVTLALTWRLAPQLIGEARLDVHCP